MPDYITKILARFSSVISTILAGLSSIIAAAVAWLSSVFAVIVAWLASLESLPLSEVFAKLSLADRLALLVAASQVVLLVLAISVEFSARKRRRAPILEPSADQQLTATRPEIPPAEEIASPPTAHAPPPTDARGANAGRTLTDRSRSSRRADRTVANYAREASSKLLPQSVAEAAPTEPASNPLLPSQSPKPLLPSQSSKFRRSNRSRHRR